MLKNLKSLFVVQEEETSEAKQAATNAKDDTTQEKDSTPQQVTLSASTNVSGVVDTAIIDKLLQAIEKNNLEGFDYLEYKKSLKALEKMPMDEATKYRSAFATASTMGVTLDKLMETANFYIGILDKENKEFTGTVKGQFNSKVSGREQDITKFNDIILTKSEQIKQLTEEIAKHQEQIANLKKQVEEDNSKIQKTQNDFNQSYAHLKSQFEDDVIKMKKYLK